MVLFVRKEAKLCIEVIHPLQRWGESKSKKGRTLWSFSSFLYHLLKWSYRNSKEHEFYTEAQ